MITPDWCRLMAAYGSEMNRRLFASAAQLTDEERRRHRGAFFGSIHATLNHILWGDRLWMSRLAEGWERPRGGITGSVALHEGFEALRAARVATDEGIERWASGLTESWLRGELVWVSGATGQEWRRPRWIMVTHLFNHGTHHRGQVHAMLTAAGVTPDDTDLPFILDLESLGLT